LSEADEIKTMLLELKLTGTIALTDRMSDAFIEAMHEEYIVPALKYDLISTHTDEWEWKVSEKGLDFLQRRKV
jgi:hypothetical protein